MELFVEKLLGFMMVLTRISAFFLLLPVFGWKSIPVRAKAGMIVLIAIFFSMITRPPLDAKQASVLKAIMLIANEATYGLALGSIVAVLFSAVKLCGQIIEREMGLTMAEILDPLTGESTMPLAGLLEMIFIVLFFSANGHHLFLLIISRSYDTFPPGSIPTVSVLVGGITEAGSALLMAGLRLAAPMLATFLVFLVVLAVLARIVPEMNILFISLPLRVGLGLLMMVIFLPLISGFTGELANWMSKLLPL
ncbi:MAG TPA: flagellar biosynthetic protein FliR [Sedimentisphaerales bacterium]|nr:flagellar biosynthetic protein FliR [Sedimentisphaerales bacterium]